jgi:arsenate reductase
MRVLFVCVGNSARSQMAEAIFNFVAPKGVSAMSAGTRPASRVNRKAVRVMQEIGLDITSAKPKLLTPKMVKKADKIITMGCLGESSCPAFLINGKSKLEDWGIMDPKDLSIQEVRAVRERIADMVMELLKELQR